MLSMLHEQTLQQRLGPATPQVHTYDVGYDLEPMSIGVAICVGNFIP